MRLFIFFFFMWIVMPVLAGAASIGVSPPSIEIGSGCAQVSVINPEPHVVHVESRPIKGIALRPENLTIHPASVGRMVVCDKGAAEGTHHLRLIAFPEDSSVGGYHPGAVVTVNVFREKNISDVTGYLTRGVLGKEQETGQSPPPVPKEGVGIIITLSIVCVGLGLKWLKKRFSGHSVREAIRE